MSNGSISCEKESYQLVQSSSVSSTRLKHKEYILKYLDVSGHLTRIKEEAIKYRKKIRGNDKCQTGLPLLVLLEVDIVLLSDISANFSSLLITEPDIAHCLIHDVVHCSVLADIPDLLPEDLQLLLRLRSLPALPSLVKTGVEGPSGIVLLQGILIAQTLPVKYIRSAVFYCPQVHCINHKCQRMKGHNIQGIPQCKTCGSEMKENCRARDVGDRIFGQLVNPDSIETQGLKPESRHQAILVCFQDDLAANLELGVRYDVAGVQKATCFQAWSIKPWKSGIESKVNHPGIPFLPLPATISTLHSIISQKCPESPWAVVAGLAAQIAADVYPTPALFHLKLGLLLSLASQGKNQPPVPILTIGADTLAVHRLMSRASQLANRCVSVNSPSLWNSFEGTAHHDEQGNVWLEAGSLLLASTGVCFLGDWAKYKTVNMSSPILKAIESGQVTVCPRKLTVPSKPNNTTLRFPLKCAAWAYKYWSPGQKPAEQLKLQTLIDVFGMPFFADMGACEDFTVQYILHSALNIGNNNAGLYYIVPDKDLQEYLTMVTTQPVKLGDRASQLIQDYFVVSRRLRPQSLPVGAVSTITALSEAHARLRMKPVVGCEDVSVVIYLYEKAMVKLFGPFYVQPPPEEDVLNAQYLPLQMHHQMVQFVKWLEIHTKSVLGYTSYKTDSEE